MWLRARDLLPIAIPVLATATLLALRIAADPPPGLTVSRSPFTDEGWDVLNARNFVVLGAWAPDDWALHSVNLPFSLASAVSFELFGPGLIQARLISVAATIFTVGLIAWWTHDRWGPVAALVAGLAFGSATLVLGYGGTALLEPLVTLLVVAGFAALTSGRASTSALLAGVLFAAAIATKPSALLMVAGVVGPSLLLHPRRAVLATGAIAAWAAGAGLALWFAAPAATDAARRIWAPIEWPSTLADAWQALIDWPAESDSVAALAGPLLVAGVIGLVVVWRGACAERRREVAVIFGWFWVPVVVLLFASYRPNRYLLPVLPALALLAGIGAAQMVGMLRVMPARIALATAFVVLIAAPGLGAWTGWVASGSSEIARMQAQVSALVPVGNSIQGDLAPVLGMSSAARLITSRPDDGINGGDLYANAGVRWFIGTGQQVPAWAPLHPDAWTNRRERACAMVDADRVCLYELP
ncbi:MAG: hypothetical protein ABI534_08100 [Chloroflexota bacterium]